jgi:hypothetical protein
MRYSGIQEGYIVSFAMLNVIENPDWMNTQISLSTDGGIYNNTVLENMQR